MSGLKPFEKCLCLHDEGYEWEAGLFSHIAKGKVNRPFVCVGEVSYKECIPYEGNEALLGKIQRVAKPRSGDQWEALVRDRAEVVSVVRETSPGVWLVLSEKTKQIAYVEVTKFVRLIREAGE